MTIEELKKDLLFQALTAKQKVFLEAYCTNGGDKTAAAGLAYPNCKNPATRLATAYDALRSKKVAYLVNRFFGFNPDLQPINKEEFLGLLADRMRNTKTRAAVFTRIADMYLRLAPWAAGEKPPETDPANVDSLVQHLESQRKQ